MNYNFRESEVQSLAHLNLNIEEKFSFPLNYNQENGNIIIQMIFLVCLFINSYVLVLLSGDFLC